MCVKESAERDKKNADLQFFLPLAIQSLLLFPFPFLLPFSLTLSFPFFLCNTIPIQNAPSQSAKTQAH
jgi:hypothetical protein